MRGLADTVSRARASKVLQQADATQLRRLMEALTSAMRTAEHATLPPAGDEVRAAFTPHSNLAVHTACRWTAAMLPGRGRRGASC